MATCNQVMTQRLERLARDEFERLDPCFFDWWRSYLGVAVNADETPIFASMFTDLEMAVRVL